jgi:hypothetical protein
MLREHHMDMQPAVKLLFLDNFQFAQQGYKRKIKSPDNFHFDSFANFNRNFFSNSAVEIQYIAGRVGRTNYAFISSSLWQECLISTNV